MSGRRGVAGVTRAALTARIAQCLCDLQLGDGAWEDWALQKDIEHFMAEADDLLTGPLAALIADAEKVQRVEEAGRRLSHDDCPVPTHTPKDVARVIRRALYGDV